MRSAYVAPLVPVEPEPPQIAHDRRFRLTRRSLGVGILDTENERAAAAAREQPVEQGGPGVADVELAGWTGREADSHVIWNREFGIWNARSNSKFLLLTSRLLVSTLSRARQSPRRGRRRRPLRWSFP